MEKAAAASGWPTRCVIWSRSALPQQGARSGSICGSYSDPVSTATLRDLITRADDHPALVMPETGARLTSGELQRALDNATSLMSGLSVEKGDRVALTAPNGPALILAFLAISGCGAAAAPLNPALGQREVRAELA